ncbi:metal ABC transporter permease [Alkalihalobacillus alcalophilus ATCC 27647 = CGMCC 1.3604]|uniref:Manganese/zinc ion transporter n=1 Tax=Alkalihalobacillus alcalophilus ATCC 27647 = CGMCC 1.3604 TaxID=1218173 RepID=J8Q780_ALKAL|nr:metal ABC transporter permease [Alkalihalobacillus alcalophilus]AFV25859.1 manganese/zinc ion transporter [Alkalihalobacillus alcalophilus ATCC 27647 = CGMCC 1.3604]KGA95915.1 metal ABC transporter permease [Alkalihalobacillus alcalophilus ATCC 27647 = CGMCC 1.3604]MED1563710.1 metal ABC transporter permease [Alkalihalobacillus alcalophilus]THG89696.1 metal ABC transporter permease [Alkalihalobacillus alcalophilus ATCC 27647 = CGMCC 1.3604]
MLEAFLRYEFLQNALLAGIMVGFLAPILGVFLVVRRLSLIADALSHITLSGIAASLLLGNYFAFFQMLNPLYMGMAFSVGGALLIEKLRSAYVSYKEVAIPIILSAGIGLGVLFISLADGFNNDLFNYLFGSVIAVSRSDVWTILFISIIVLIVLILFYKELFFLSFDEEQAVVSGLNRRFFHILFIIIVALVIAVSMRVVGILLVSSLMTLPVAAAMRFARGFKQMFVYSVIFSQISVIGGLMLAFQLDLAPGGTIVLIAVFIFLISVFIHKFRLGKGVQGKMVRGV